MSNQISLQKLPVLRATRPYADDLAEDMQNLQRVIANLSEPVNAGESKKHVAVDTEELTRALSASRVRLDHPGTDSEILVVDQKFDAQSDSGKRDRSIANLLAIGTDFIRISKQVGKDLGELVAANETAIKSIPEHGKELFQFFKSHLGFQDENQRNFNATADSM